MQTALALAFALAVTPALAQDPIASDALKAAQDLTPEFEQTMEIQRSAAAWAAEMQRSQIEAAEAARHMTINPPSTTPYLTMRENDKIFGLKP